MATRLEIAKFAPAGPARSWRMPASMLRMSLAVLAALSIPVLGCSPQGSSQSIDSATPVNYIQPQAPAGNSPQEATSDNQEQEMETATFGNGCFWCTEAVFAEVNGVVSAESGYTGGRIANPTYRQVCTGATGHAEAVRITYDPSVISYTELLEIFWKTHDPTTLNRQGADVGTQYRSVVFFHNDEQKRLAEEYKEKLNEAGIWNRPIVTTIEEAAEFYVAEDYHQDYFKLNSQQGYCQAVIVPKLEKFREVFADKLKMDE